MRRQAPDVPARAQPPTPIAKFAAELNPPEGAFGDALPFALTPETSTATDAIQSDLFTAGTQNRGHR